MKEEVKFILVANTEITRRCLVKKVQIIGVPGRHRVFVAAVAAGSNQESSRQSSCCYHPEHFQTLFAWK